MTLQIVVRQAPLSMGFSRQEYWSGLPAPPPGESSLPGDQTWSHYVSCICRKFFTTSATWKASRLSITCVIKTELTFLYNDLDFPSSSAGKESACNAGDPGLIFGLGSSPGEGIGYPLQYSWASLVAQAVKNLPAMPETWVCSLGLEDPLKEGLATHSSIPAWRIPMDRGAWRGLQSMGLQSKTQLKRLSTAQNDLHFATPLNTLVSKSAINAN